MGKFVVFPALNSLCRAHEKHKSLNQLNKYLNKTCWTPEDRQSVLNLLSEALLERELRPHISRLFAPILSDLFIRISRRAELKSRLFIAVSDLIGCYGCGTQFAYHCFQTSIFCPKELFENCKNDDTVLDLLISSFRYLHFHPLWFRDAIDWSFVVNYLSHPKSDIKYVAIKCYQILFSLSDNQFQTLFGENFSDEELTELQVKYLDLFSPPIPTVQISDSLYYDQSSDNILHFFDDKDFSDDIVSVFGVLINKFRSLDSNHKNPFDNKNRIVLVPTTQSNIRSIALAVSYGKPILVEGPVGCGKTLLIEYMSSLTGRHKAPHLMKVQMGDQIDTKILIGSHICTDIPGEFIWKAGPLTQAMKYGYWLLLEDIDCAPSDVISILSSVLEAKSLSSLPGCENQLNRVHNEFRIFFTRRLICAQNNDSNHSEFALKSSLHYNCLNKLCFKISLGSLSREELSDVISKKWQNLCPISSRVLDIYYYLQNEDSETIGLKRQVSLRDLMKWCQRISKKFKLNSEESAINTFLDANDCFLQSISSPDLRIAKAEVIGTLLNINKSQSEYLCSKRKPEFLLNEKILLIGRISFSLKERTINLFDERKRFQSFALTLQSLSLLERVSVAVQNNESVLLCGETGTGKTSCVQYLAHRLNKDLTVVNINQQSDSSDLLGGYKPIEMKILMEPIKNKYLELFSKTFESEKNVSFLMKFSQKFKSEDWSTLFEVMIKVYESALKKSTDIQLTEDWKQLAQTISRLKTFKLCEKGCLAFSFIDGSLVKAMRNGDWILLDEINLAETETLQCLSAILDSEDGSVILLDKADGLPVERSPDFRLFACMNPATDIGKKELPLGIRNRFSEFFVDELEDKSDLRILVHSYIGPFVVPNLIESIVTFYLQIKIDAKRVLTDANGMRPLYSLRTLCRALSVAATNPCGIVLRSLYESFCLSFLTRLDNTSRVKVETDIIKALFGSKDSLNILRAKLEAPKSPENYQFIEGFYILRGTKEPKLNDSYILTPTVQKNLKDICRIVSVGKTFPVLLEGETSVGKTSLIEWLAAATGNVCVRVNNHEHTDLQEYVGSYCANTVGKLVFKEGVLAEAMRNGYWIILDELNLAPTEVLEALNRVLDDNRELFIPETQQLIKADPKFLLFATQNPAGHYGGRKLLSRAFRNRFVELHFDVIPSVELEVILHQRCTLPMSYAKRMVGVLIDLQIRRRESGVFAGKHGFITLRDLFRWGERYKKFAKQQNDIQFYDWDLHLANDGYMLLAGRVRKPEEIQIIQTVLEIRFKRKLDTNAIFNGSSFLKAFENIPEEFNHIVWNKSFRRLGTLLSEAIKYEEPVLLVGETGCGKTSICQLFAAINNRRLYSINCHMNTESADFLGSLRPVRHYDNISDDKSSRPLFEWVDGPLVDAMKTGDYFLVDEISLADDSVLERLNSVLESERTLLIAENNNCLDSEMSVPIIKAKDSFRYLATMNPGGDYGKKELSPALRNRFTEIWCPPYEDISDIQQIICHNLDNKWIDCKEVICKSISDFLLWFNSNVFNSKRIVLSIRDILSWIQFINVSTQSNQVIPISLSDGFINGALLVFVDGIGSSNFINFNKNSTLLREECHRYLNQISECLLRFDANCDKTEVILNENEFFRIGKFFVPKAPEVNLLDENHYMWNSPTVQTNALRVMRALRLPKPILLEGMPGVGKTSLVQALAKVSGHRLIRINLSEQTDISDLFGADLPIEGQDSVGKFAFRDGPLLQALKSDWTWIVLDELNLASQSVLEGLNACLDHRSEIFIPELNKSFKISKTMTRIFATQNPHSEGGARKGLPRSFLNRFTTVYMESLLTEDYVFILSKMFPNINQSIIKQMVALNNEVIDEIVVKKQLARKGSPWEFNLRDLIRWSQVMVHNVSDFDQIKPQNFVKLLFIDKMRTIEDKIKMKDICDKYFDSSTDCPTIDFKITDNYLQIGHSFLRRNRNLGQEINNLFIFETQKECLESLVKCIQMNWMSILIGDNGTGKTSAVQLLSDLTGNKLHIFSVNSEMDTMDLLGGFEQKDLSHRLSYIENSVIQFCSKLFQKWVRKEPFKQIMCYWFEIQTLNSMNESSDEISLKKLKLLNQMTEKLMKEVNPKERDLLKNLNNEINVLKSNYKNTELLNGTFEWRDSILIRALTSGEWLLIDNANLCSASVLDRLNPLLEPNGELTINEKGCVNGKLTSVRPHPDFRLFLSMNPINGELSRAMRNRGIEINMFPITSKEDFNKLMSGSVKSEDNISEFFVQLFDKFCVKNEMFCFSQIIEYIKSFTFQIQNGFQLEISLKEFFSKIDKNLIINEEIGKLVEKIRSKVDSQKIKSRLFLNHFKYDSSTSSAVEDSLLLKSVVKSQNGLTIELNGEYLTALRIYLEMSSVNDNHIRNYILRVFPSEDCFDNNKQMVQRISENISKILPKGFELDVLKEFPIDLRHISNVWNLFLNLNQCFDNNVSLIEEYLNRYSINLFWDQLKCQQIPRIESNDKSIMSFMSVGSDLKSNKINRKLFPKVFVPIFDIINEIEVKLIDRSLELCPTNDDFMTLRDILLWFYQLLIVCHQSSSKSELTNSFITEKFIVLWILTNEKCVSILQSFLDIDLNSDISGVNQMLKIEVMETDKKKQKLLNSLTKNYLIFKTKDSAKLFISYAKLIDDLFRTNQSTISSAVRDSFSLIAQNICDLISGQYNRLHLEKDISYIQQKIQNLSNVEMSSEDEELVDFEAIKRRKSMANIQLEPIVQFCFFYSELSHLINRSDNFLVNYFPLIESKHLILNPIHISCLKWSKNSDFISTDLIIQHFIDFNQFMKIENIFNHLYLDYNHSNKSFESEIIDRKLLESTADCLPFVSLVSSHLLSDKHNLIGLFNSKITQLKCFQQFLTLNFDQIYGSKNNCFTKLYFEFTRSWFSSLLQNIAINSPVKRNSLSVKNDGFNEVFNKISHLIEESKDPFDESIVSIYVGLISSKILCPVFSIDPIERNNLKLNHCLIDLKLIETDINIRSLLSVIKSGHSSVENSDHPLIKELIQRRNRLKEKIKKFESNSSYRSSSGEYFQLKSDCNQFLQTILDMKTIENYSKKLVDSYKNPKTSQKSLQILIQESINFQISINSFIKRIQMSYPLYKDLINVFLIGVSLLLKGLRNATFLLKKQNFVSNELQFESVSDLSTTIKIIGNFCNTYSPAFIANYLCDSETITKLTKLSNVSKIDFEFIVSTLLRSALLEIQNQMQLNSCESLVLDSFRILNVFVKSWQKLRENEEIKRLEEESLFEYRTKTHESELSEEELDKKQLNNTFPTYHEHYKDFIDEITLQNDNQINLIDSKSEEDIVSDIIRIHLQIVDPFNRSDENVPNFRKSYSLRHLIVSQMTKSLGIFFDNSIDSELIDGQIIVCHQMISDIENSKSLETFNIYHNSSLHETNLCFKILESLENRIINELLPQFESHPVLIKLLKLIKTIYDFSSKDPLIKLATGLEVLLKAAQDWQLIAHKGISLVDNLNEITQLMISWRKMELKYWSECLDSVNTKVNEKQIKKFWFHLFITITALRESQSTKDCNQNEIKEFVVSIKQFIEGSKLGEFKVRLNLLQSFMFHVLAIETDPNNDCLFISLYNLYKFYSQFVPNIENALMSVRNPIEKEIKEFVKIAKWNDQNFWSVKTAVDKSHNQLFRYMKKYESALNLPISSHLVVQNNENKSSYSEWKLVLNFVKQFKTKSENLEPINQLIEYKLLQRSCALIKKSKILSKRTVKKCCSLVIRINGIESFTSELITGIKELSELQVPSDIKDKTKWKQKAHHIQNRKHRALSGLLKTLTFLGLSYRKGLIINTRFDINHIIMTTGPLDYNNQKFEKLSQQLSEDLSSSDKYFFKCLARFASLQLGLESPNKQLSIGTVDRIKGFSTQLMKKVIQNRNMISQNLNVFNRFKSIEQNLKSFLKNNEKSFIVPNKEFEEYLKSVQNIIIKIIAFILRSIDLLDSLSTSIEEPVLLLSNSSNINICQQNINEWKHCLNQFYSKFNELTLKLKELEFEKTLVIYSSHNLEQLKSIYKTLSTLVIDLNIYYSSSDFSALNFITKFSVLFNESQELDTKFTKLSDYYNGFQVSIENIKIQKDVDLSAKYSIKSIKNILVSIEKIYKYSDKIEEIGSEDEDLLNNCLNAIELIDVLNDFQIENTFKTVEKFLESVNISSKSVDNSENQLSSLRLKVQIVKNIYPFIENYVKLFEYFLTLSMSSLRTSNKLLLILLSLFTDLAQNGFCSPQELSDESDEKDNGSQLKNVEDGGLGEGQGTKDISDKIESEDQIEDAFKEGTEKTEENEERDIGEEENGIEMHNDFEGQTFSPSKADEEEDDKNDSDGEESDDDLDKQMGDVDNNSDVLDEKIWGSDDDNDSDQSDADEDDTGFDGKESIDNKVVAKDENKDFQKDFDESQEKDDKQEEEEETEINENQSQNDEYEDETIDPYKQNEPKNDKSKEEFPENMTLDDKEDNEEQEDISQELDNMSISGQSSSDDEKQSETDEQNFEEMDLSDEELNGDQNDRNEDLMEELDNQTKNEENDQQIDETEKEENESKEEDKTSVNPEKNSENLSNNEMNGSDNKDKQIENNSNAKNSSDVCVEQNDEKSGQQNETIEEQHGFNESLIGDNSTQTDGQQMVSSAAVEEEEAKDQKFKQNENREKNSRSLTENYDKSVKRQKVLPNESQDNTSDPQNDSEKQRLHSKLYRHIDNKSKANNQVIDIATNEEKSLQNEELDNKTADDFDLNQTEDMEIQEKEQLIEEIKPIDFNSTKNKTNSSDNKDIIEDDKSEEVMETEGQNVDTITVQRGNESTFHTSIGLLNSKESEEMSETIDKQTDEKSFETIKELDINSVIEIWKECESKVSPLVYELCERLQLVLEPTKTAKLKGDYRTGKRLNMRKVIAYIASDFRKDKIWLRRTKPSKRQYQIVIAIDDSSSMADNKSKQLAFESLALLGKSLSILEAGELAVISFGQTVNLLHTFNDSFNDNTGAKLLTQLTFEQTQTRIADLLLSAIDMLSNSRRTSSSQNSDISQLLIVVSDGRGIYSEGEQKVKQTIRRVKELGIFTVFVVIDNPLSKDSILDIRVPIFDNTGNVRIESYMERFPFPFYILLRDINGLPVVMGEALRQWFELITSGQT